MFKIELSYDDGAKFNLTRSTVGACVVCIQDARKKTRGLLSIKVSVLEPTK